MTIFDSFKTPIFQALKFSNLKSGALQVSLAIMWGIDDLKSAFWEFSESGDNCIEYKQFASV